MAITEASSKRLATHQDPRASATPFASFSGRMVVVYRSRSHRYIENYHGYLSVVIWVQVIRDGIPHLVSIVLFRTGTAAVHVVGVVLVFCLGSRRFIV